LSRLISQEEFESISDYSMRRLLNCAKYELIDTLIINPKGAILRHFVIDIGNEKIYEINLEEAYNIMALYVCDDVHAMIVWEFIESVIGEVE